MGLFLRRGAAFVAPPCCCADIERYVIEAIAMRDEMAAWPTPLQAWERLQRMPILRARSERSVAESPHFSPVLGLAPPMYARQRMENVDRANPANSWWVEKGDLVVASHPARVLHPFMFVATREEVDDWPDEWA